jgi:hypothetical protein
MTRRWLLLLLTLFAPFAAHAQTTAVTGNVRDIATVPLTTVTSTQITFELKNFSGRIPKSGGLAIGNIKVAFKPDMSGNFSGTVYANAGIDPSGTYYNVCIENSGKAVRCERYLVSGTTWVLGTATPLVVLPILGPNQLVLHTFPCIVSVAATTWTCTHNFNESPVTVGVFDTAGRQIFPDTTDVSNLNVTRLTFVSPQPGTALISHAGAVTIATTQPNAVLQNPTAGRTIQDPGLNVSSPTTFTGAVICRNFQNVRCVDAANSAGWAGSDVGAWVNAALADTPNGGTVQIAPGAYTLSTQIVLTSNSSIECSPNNGSLLTASVSFNAVMFLASGINHFRIEGCVLDGNRVGNANQFGSVSLVNTLKGKVVGNHFQNFSGGRIINLSSGSNSNTIRDNEIDHYGPMLPAVANGNEAIALAPSGSGAGVQDNDVIHNFIHDGNGGIGIYNSNAAPSVTANTSNNRILDNRIQALANDAILLFNSNGTSNGSLIQGTLIKGNFLRCNGWPANGTGWDSTNCPPGLLQTGSSAGQGVGINLNSSLQDQTQVIGNRSGFNFYEGGDDTPQNFSTVNTSNGALGSCVSNCVQWVSGDSFLTTWKQDQAIVINGVFYTIASVQGAQTTLMLNSAPGSQTGVLLSGYSCSRSLWSGNYFFNNGNGAAPGGQGSGLAIQGCDVTSEGNFAYGNAFSGFFDQGAVYVSHVGDHSVQNCRVAACNEFNAQVALGPKYIGVTSDATNGNALFFGPSTRNAFAESPSLCETGVGCGAIAVQDQGTNDVFSDGKARGASNTNGGTHSLCFLATGGTGCLNYGGGPGGFSMTLPALNGPLTGTVASGTATMTTALIGAGACGTTVTVSASGVLTTDTITHSYAAAVGANPGVLTLNVWPTANNVNFAYCNPTAAGLTPTAATLNWRVLR